MTRATLVLPAWRLRNLRVGLGHAADVQVPPVEFEADWDYVWLAVRGDGGQAC